MKYLALTLLAVTFLLPATASAELPATMTTYTLATSPATAQKKIEAGIEKAVEDMMFITRPIARSRLKSTNAAYKSVGVQKVGDKILISYNGDKPITQVNGKPGKWTRADGETFTVTHTLKGDVLTQKFVAEDGVKLVTFVFSRDGKSLNFTVRLTSEKLAAPMVYTLPYKIK